MRISFGRRSFLLATMSFFSCAALAPALAQSLKADDPKIQTFENGLVDRMERNQANATRWSIEDRLALHGVPGAGVAILENGEVIWAKGYGVKRVGGNDAIDTKTVFSVGSVSKMINAALVLRLAAEGLVDLDTDVNQYLKSWKVPDNGYTQQNKVTLRAILSHTAGFSQHGFRDFQPGAELPNAIETLNRPMYGGRRPV
ncbi:MAG: serine hydrolase domain-containing protein, partial [Pseudomonadota bacterium]